MPVNASETTGRKTRFPSTTSSSLAAPRALLALMFHINWLADAAACAGANAGEIVRASGVTTGAPDGFGIPICEVTELVDVDGCVSTDDVTCGDACPQSRSIAAFAPITIAAT